MTDDQTPSLTTLIPQDQPADQPAATAETTVLDPVPLRGGARHRPGSEEGLVVRVGMEGDQRVWHQDHPRP